MLEEEDGGSTVDPRMGSSSSTRYDHAINPCVYDCKVVGYSDIVKRAWGAIHRVLQYNRININIKKENIAGATPDTKDTLENHAIA